MFAHGLRIERVEDRPIGDICHVDRDFDDGLARCAGRRQRGKQIGQRLVRLCGEIGLWRVSATVANRQLAGNEYEAAGSDRVGIVAAGRRGISRIHAEDLRFTSH